jgi:hypothetical protein
VCPHFFSIASIEEEVCSLFSDAGGVDSATIMSGVSNTIAWWEVGKNGLQMSDLTGQRTTSYKYN